jgi:chemotaxis protein MotB
MAKKKKEKLVSTWLNTYSDLITLCLCFFAVMFDPQDEASVSMAQISASFMRRGMGAQSGGNTLSTGRLADLGNNIMSLPATDHGKSLGTAMRKAISLFAPEVRSKKMSVMSDERGVVISLASDAFFRPNSADINIEETRDVLLRLGTYLSSPELAGRKFRVEGHTDDTPLEPAGPWKSNWELSAARAISVLDYLTGLGIDDKQFQVAAFADTMPIASNDTPEGRAYNRRVDIIILDDAHL